MESDTTFIPLGRMAERLNVPAKWLREEAMAGRVPCLHVGEYLRFKPDEVERALMERARREVRNGTR